MRDPDLQRPHIFRRRRERLDELLHRLLVASDALERNHLALDREDRLDVQELARPGARAPDASAASQELERVHREDQLGLVFEALEQRSKLVVGRAAVEPTLDRET